MSLITELKRRNVFRVAAAYVVLSWLALQVGDILFQALSLPEWTLRMLVALVALGFVPVLIFSWVYELTPDGLKKESEIDGSDSITDHTAKKLDYITIGAVALALAVLGITQLRNDAPIKVEQPVAETSPVPVAQPKGIAVLPFENLSEDESNAFFAGGVHEEILTHLSRIGDLRVISRTSMLRIAESKLDIRAIGQRLGVSHVLEGSVRKAGDRVRVTVQLIDAGNDEHVWAENYDRTLTDIFAIQSDIALAIADRLHSELSPEATALIAEIPTKNQEAYELYLRAVEERRDWRFIHTFTAMQALLERAVELDPDFVQAQALMVTTYGRIYWLGEDTEGVYRDRATEKLAEVKARWPNRSETQMAAANYAYTVDRDYETSLAGFEAVLKEKPNEEFAVGQMSSSLKRLNRLPEFFEFARRWLQLNPEGSSAASEMTLAFLYNGMIEEAVRFSTEWTARYPEDSTMQMITGRAILYGLGDLQGHRDAMRLVREPRYNVDTGADQFWALYLVEGLQAARNAYVEHVVGSPGTIAVAAEFVRILRTEGLDAEAAQISADLLKVVADKIGSGQFFLTGEMRAAYTLAAYVAILAGDEAAYRQYRSLAAKSDPDEYFSGGFSARIMAFAHGLAGNPEKGWLELRPYLVQPGILSRELIVATLPRWEPVFGDLPEFQEYIAGPKE
jgi:TolB-like protein